MQPSRRRLLGAAALAAMLAGCGFQLRRPPELAWKRVFLSGFAEDSTLADELRRQLRASPGVTVAETPAEADLIVESLQDASEQVVAATTANSQISEMTLRARLRFRVRTPAGRDLIAPTELVQSRDMSYSESSALAKQHEAALLFRSMHADLAMQVLRRLAALGPA
ncbi:LPS assembly lipoprotein LptE [Sphaerotilus uruguayifluvii]|uniref:LPS-assembly lipoprotein LptE n=1 Tax=Sphaerotilus uruguayifluvii TaxID=2735897 RepID=A0ABX2FZQ5_9BURK|nr:LPS-assembly lipoprotein [Leptothrix sp. C29]